MQIGKFKTHTMGNPLKDDSGAPLLNPTKWQKFAQYLPLKGKPPAASTNLPPRGAPPVSTLQSDPSTQLESNTPTNTAAAVASPPPAGSGRSIGTRCKSAFQQRRAELMGDGLDGARATDQAAAESVFQTLRLHYKGKPKSNNKFYGGNAAQEKKTQRTENARKSLDIMTRLTQQDASPGAYIAAGVGNCEEMTEAAVALAQGIGARAEHWLLAGSVNPHSICVIGQIPPSVAAASASAGGAPSLDVFAGANVHVVDLWAGICCPAEQYKDAFIDKMQSWRADSKEIGHFVLDPDTGIETRALVSPTSTQWLNDTVHARPQRLVDLLAQRSSGS